jgi:hypothetical protein
MLSGQAAESYLLAAFFYESIASDLVLHEILLSAIYFLVIFGCLLVCF